MILDLLIMLFQGQRYLGQHRGHLTGSEVSTDVIPVPEVGTEVIPVPEVGTEVIPVPEVSTEVISVPEVSLEVPRLSI